MYQTCTIHLKTLRNGVSLHDYPDSPYTLPFQEPELNFLNPLLPTFEWPHLGSALLRLCQSFGIAQFSGSLSDQGSQLICNSVGKLSLRMSAMLQLSSLLDALGRNRPYMGTLAVKNADDSGSRSVPRILPHLDIPSGAVNAAGSPHGSHN